MQRILAGLLCIPAAALFAGLPGCGKEEKPKTPSTLPPLASRDSGGGKGGGPKTMIKRGTAKLVGRVVFDGDPPTPESLEARMKEHKDRDTCLAGMASEKIEQTWIIDKNKGVANVVIWLNPPSNSEFEVKEDKSDAVIDQPHCVYVPHILAMKPGQKLLIKNSAPMAHNTKLDTDTSINRNISPTIAPRDSVTVELKPQPNPVNVVCDFHGWMKAKIWVLPHQYVAVTKDDGTFEIDGVPEGEFSVVAWHEGASPAFFYGGKSGTKTTIKSGENKLDLKVSAK